MGHLFYPILQRDGVIEAKTRNPYKWGGMGVGHSPLLVPLRVLRRLDHAGDTANKGRPQHQDVSKTKGRRIA